MPLKIDQYQSLLELSKSEHLVNGSFELFINQAILTISRELNVSRVSFWSYDANRELIKNELLYDRLSTEFIYEGILEKKDYPNYFNAFLNELCILADDAATDERTKEFKENYLNLYDIKSMLDVQVSVQGKLFGIICLENTHKIRNWKKNEELFVSNIASYIAQSHLTKIKIEEENKRKQSETNYQTLFLDSPVPMWVFHPTTHKFLAVNKAAIQNYGYTEKEFLKMTIFDIRPKNEIEKLKIFINKKSKSKWKSSDWKHQLKNKDIINVEISSDWTTFHGERARIVIALNITNEKLEEENRKNLDKFKKFAFYASHNLRGPVSRLLGLNTVINDERNKNGVSKYTLDAIHQTVIEIDDVIKVLNKKLEQ